MIQVNIKFAKMSRHFVYLKLRLSKFFDKIKKMEIFKKALSSKRSTIIYGHYGRYPSLVEFYLNSISELEPASDHELIFWYRPNLYDSRLLYVFIEPPFDAVIPSNIWTIVLTSHLQLSWNPSTTQIIKCTKLLNVPKPVEVHSDQTVIEPSTSHVWPFYEMVKNVQIDLSSVENVHEAYLKLLTIFDLLSPSSIWSLSMKHELRKNLLEKIRPNESNFYEAILLKTLG